MADLPDKQHISPEQVQEFLRKYYSDPSNPGSGAGWNRLYDTLKLKYTGIRQIDVQTFLRSVPGHQQVQPRLKSGVIKPITSSRAFGVVQIDETQYGDSYILLAKDIYSGYLWGNHKKSSHNTQDTIKLVDRIVEDATARGAKIGVIQTDNGTIFKNEELGNYLQSIKIKQLFSLTYNSRTQGAIEKANRDLKTKMAQYDFQPTQKDLQLFIDSHNATVSLVTGTTPKQALETKGIVKAGKPVTKATSRLKPGDYVRVPSDRNYNKGYDEKWSDDVYRVEKVTGASLQQPRYKIEGQDRQLYRRDLIRSVAPDQQVELDKRVLTTAPAPKRTTPYRALLRDAQEGEAKMERIAQRQAEATAYREEQKKQKATLVAPVAAPKKKLNEVERLEAQNAYNAKKDAERKAREEAEKKQK